MKRRARLKKGPDIQDYVVEVITGTAYNYHYFTLRSEARRYAKDMSIAGRVRTFRIKYTLVADSKK